MLQSLPFYVPIIVFAFCFLLPKFFEVDIIDLAERYSGDERILLAGIVLSVPLGLDIILDLQYLKSTKWDPLHWFSRIIIFFGISTPYFVHVGVTYSNHNSSTVVMNAICAETFRNVAFCGAIFALTSRAEFGNVAYKWCSPYALSLLMMACVIGFSTLGLVQDFYPRDEMSNDSMNQLRGFSALFQFVLVLCIILFAVWWIQTLILKVRSHGTLKITIQEVYTSAYFACFSVVYIIYLINALAASDAHRAMNIEYIQLAVKTVILLIPGRISKEHIKELEQHLDQKNTFVRYISHEIRTPLNTVFLGISFVKLEVEKLYSELGSSRLKAILETMHDSTDSCQIALDTLNELLMFDKFECGKLTVDLEPTSPWQFLNEACKQFRQAAEQRLIQLNIVCEDIEKRWFRDYFVRLDENKFNQVMRNLISNALKFTPDGGKIEVTMSKIPYEEWLQRTYGNATPNTKNNNGAYISGRSGAASGRSSGRSSVKLNKNASVQPINTSTINLNLASASASMRSTQNRPAISNSHSSSSTRLDGVLLTSNSDDEMPPVLRIEVKDSGAGISPGNLPRLFGQYVQFDADRLQGGGGSGLGLWITKGIVEMHGGRIGALSEGEGMGTTFFIELPLRYSHELSLRSRIDHWSDRGLFSRKHSIDTGRHTATSQKPFIASAPFVTAQAFLKHDLQRLPEIPQSNNSQNSVAPVSGMLGSTSAKQSNNSSNTNTANKFPSIQGIIQNIRLNRSSSHSEQVIPSARQSSFDIENGVGPLLEGVGGGGAGGIDGGGGRSGQGQQSFTTHASLDTAHKSWASGLSFLVVDDSLANRKVVKRLLCCHGHTVDECVDGGACVQMLTNEHELGNVDPNNPTSNNNTANKPNRNAIDKDKWYSHYDVILMDDNMPHLCGPEASQVLREKGFAGLIIGVTGNTLPEDVKRFIDCGATSVLAKPLNLDLLKSIIEKHIN